MASVHISIDSETVLSRFHRALNKAGTISSDMIEVGTKIIDGAVLKVVRTECPWAISVFRSLSAMELAHD